MTGLIARHHVLQVGRLVVDRIAWKQLDGVGQHIGVAEVEVQFAGAAGMERVVRFAVDTGT